MIAFPHQAILQALKEQPEGVSPEYFNNQKSYGIDLSNPKAVGEAMKDSNVIIYRIELGLYTLMSTAHRTALSTYPPKAPGDGLYHKHLEGGRGAGMGRQIGAARDGAADRRCEGWGGREAVRGMGR